MKLKKFLVPLAALIVSSRAPMSWAVSPMTLTSQAISQGFTLTDFATGFPGDSDEANGTAGPLGIAFPSTGGVLVTDAPGNLRLFPTDTDGQDISAAPSLQNFGHNNALGLVKDGSNFYMTQQPAGDVVQVDPTTGAIVKTLTSISNATGITVNPTNGHLIVSTYQVGQIWDVNPSNGATNLLLSQFFDGVSTD